MYVGVRVRGGLGPLARFWRPRKFRTTFLEEIPEWKTFWREFWRRFWRRFWKGFWRRTRFQLRKAPPTAQTQDHQGTLAPPEGVRQDHQGTLPGATLDLTQQSDCRFWPPALGEVDSAVLLGAVLVLLHSAALLGSDALPPPPLADTAYGNLHFPKVFAISMRKA